MFALILSVCILIWVTCGTAYGGFEFNLVSSNRPANILVHFSFPLVFYFFVSFLLLSHVDSYRLLF